MNVQSEDETAEYQLTSVKNNRRRMSDRKEPNQVESTSKLKNNATDHLIIFEQTLQFIHVFGYLLGINISYDWKPNLKFYNTIFVLILIWSQMFYTQFLHIKNKEYYKLLEVFACYGITLSVIIHQILRMSQPFEKILTLKDGV